MLDINRFLVSLTLCILAGCAYTVFGEGDRLDYTLPEEEGWALGFENYTPSPGGGGVWLWEFVRPGQSVDDWQELVTVMRTYRDILKSKPGNYFEGLKKIREKNCPGSTRWNVIQETDDSLLYEWWAKPCMGFDTQHEIAIIKDGRRDRFLFRYTHMGADMGAGKREQWMKLLLASKVMIDEP